MWIKLLTLLLVPLVLFQYNSHSSEIKEQTNKESMTGLNAVRIASKTQPAKQAIIIFHGLGDSGSGWSFLAELLQRDPAFSQTRFVFPNAPTLNIVANGNYPMPAWFNIYDWGGKGTRTDVDGFLKSLNVIKNCVQEQIESGIAPENIIVGGFSQGAALALASSATLPVKIGGFISLSGFSVANESIANLNENMNLDTPIFHGHGDQDPIISLQRGLQAKEFYTKECGVKNYTMQVYQGMAHSTCPEEVRDFVSFIKKVYNI